MAKMGWQEAVQLDDSLVSLTDYFPDPPEEMELLSGGLSNRCWKISHQDRQYVWRPVSKSTSVFGISRANEYHLLVALSSYQFSPNPVLNNDRGLLVNWIDGQPVGDQISQDELLNTLATIHNVQINDKPIQKLLFSEKVDHLWMQLANEQKDEALVSLYKKHREPLYLPESLKTLCHLDLGAYNLIRARDGIGVIDWEYSAIGDPRMDLAMTIEVSGLSPEIAVAMYCHYRGIDLSDMGEWQQNVELWLPKIRLLGMLWYQIGYQLWGDDLYYERFQQLKMELLKTLN
ncbi:thiamine kinase [Vibrio penaeicida]|uniref:Thiamine kinase n=2 Tax=Vibrio penaeicida TaxID=104609 RepID=A0AAV5NXJ7_9VIBR|nr:thiamine kinase [Vibrio penaeicida]GLQ75450.1 thiamine kinase [Vibrio penaeicida]